MPKVTLTEAALKRLTRPGSGRREISDTEKGLFLFVSETGSKTWTVIFRLADGTGKRSTRVKMTIGSWPGMGVEQARTRCREIMEAVRSGEDPRKQAEQEAIERETGSLNAIVELYGAAMDEGKLIGGRKRPVTKSTAKSRMSMLTRLVLPDLGRKALHEITREDVARVLSRIEKAGGPVDETLKVVRSVFKFAAGRALFSGTPPTAGMTKRQPSVAKARALTDEDLRALWGAAGEYGYPFGHALRLLMLTGQRRNEISHARWSEIDWSRKILTVPAERVKNRAGDHELPLSDAAIAVLKEARAAYEATGLVSGYVFPSDIGDTPISGWSKVKPKIDRAVQAEIAGLTKAEKRAVSARGALRSETVERKAEALEKIAQTKAITWRIHDLRHTFITRVRDGEENADGEIVYSAPLDVLQAVVNHEITAGVTGHYDHGDIQRRYRLRKREVLDWWARKLMRIVGETGTDETVVVFAKCA